MKALEYNEKKYFWLNNPALNEFVFNAIATATNEQRAKFSVIELKVFRDRKTIRRFADMDNWERKSVYLTKLGYSFVLTIGQDLPEQNEKIMKALPDQWESPEKRMSVIGDMATAGMFMVGSKQFMECLQYGSMNSASQLYILNYDYVKMGEYLKSIRATFPEHFSNAVAAFDMLSKLMGIGNQLFENSETICGIDPNHMRILLCIYPHRNTYITPQRINDMLHIPVKNMKSRNTCANMYRAGLVGRMKNSSGNNKQGYAYTILESGIEAVGKFLKYLINNALYKN